MNIKNTEIKIEVLQLFFFFVTNWESIFPQSFVFPLYFPLIFILFRLLCNTYAAMSYSLFFFKERIHQFLFRAQVLLFCFYLISQRTPHKMAEKKEFKWQVRPGGTIPSDSLGVKHATGLYGKNYIDKSPLSQFVHYFYYFFGEITYDDVLFCFVFSGAPPHSLLSA